MIRHAGENSRKAAPIMNERDAYADKRRQNIYFALNMRKGIEKKQKNR